MVAVILVAVNGHIIHVLVLVDRMAGGHILVSVSSGARGRVDVGFRVGGDSTWVTFVTFVSAGGNTG